MEKQSGIVTYEPEERCSSPYTRRFPMIKSKSQNELDGYSNVLQSGRNSIQVQDFHLPIEMHSRRSISYIRSRRDPHLHGIRSLKAKRAIQKSGERNVFYLNLPQKSYRFLKDIVTTLIEEQWRFTLLAFVMSFFTSWLSFTILWYLIAYAHGDLEFDKITGNRTGDGQMPCINGATSFGGFLLLSIETQVTTGYGNKYPTEECPEAIFLMILQIVTGVVIDGAMIGIVYAKLTRPHKYVGTKFSKKAVICQRNGKLCFIFRICDYEKTHVINSKVKAFLMEEGRTLEGEIGPRQISINLPNNGNILIMWPITVCHVIDSKSPFFDMSAKDLLEKKFEIVITITGGSWSTGSITQSRTSYLPKEVFWGHRFENIIECDDYNDYFTIENERFDNIVEIDTPLCSARRMKEVFDEVQSVLEQKRAEEVIENIEVDYNMLEHDSMSLNSSVIEFQADSTSISRETEIKSTFV